MKARYRYNKRQRQGRLKRLLLISATLLFVGSLSGYAALAVGKPVPAVAAEPSLELAATPQAVSGLAWPAAGQAAIGSLADGLLAATENQHRQPMASITKVVTALAVLEKLPLEPGQQGPSFTITQTDIDHYRRYVSRFGAVMPINLGQSITQYDALNGLMLPSANNIADSLAVWVFGSMDGYLKYANDMLMRLGLEDSVVADASGFNPGSQSTPADLIALGQKALNHPILKEIIAKKSAVVPVSGELRSTNLLLADAGAVGIKTGNTDEAGSCLLYAYRFGPAEEHVFIGVVMGQPNYFGMFASARALKDSALPHFKAIEILPAGTRVGSISSPWGGSTEVVTAQPLKIYGWAGKSYPVQVDLAASDPPILKSQVVGRASVGETNVNLIAKEPLDTPGIFWRLRNYW